MMVGTKNRPPKRRTLVDNNTTSRGAGVHEALVNDPAKGGRIFPSEGTCLRLVTAPAVETSEEWVTGQGLLGYGASSRRWRKYKNLEKPRRR